MKTIIQVGNKVRYVGEDQGFDGVAEVVGIGKHEILGEWYDVSDGMRYWSGTIKKAK